MNDWPQWFTDPVTTPPATTPEYRMQLVRRRITEINELVAVIKRVAESAPSGENVRSVLSHLAAIKGELARAEKKIGTK